MRRVLAILKYVPAVLCGLLVVAWVVSVFCEVGIICAGQAVSFDAGRLRSTPSAVWQTSWGNRYYYMSANSPTTNHWQYLGYFLWNPGRRILSFPIPAIVTLLIPIATGLLTRFRFPLWSYFAWTALIAAELAYYLR